MNINKALEQLEESVASLENFHKSQEYDEQEMSEIAKTYWAIRMFDERVKEIKSRIFRIRDDLEKGILPREMEARDTDMVRVPSLGRSFYPLVKTSASMHDKLGGMEWLKANGHGDIIQEVVNAGTLGSFAKSLIEEQGMDLPEQFFKVSTYSTIGSSKYTPKD